MQFHMEWEVLASYDMCSITNVYYICLHRVLHIYCLCTLYTIVSRICDIYVTIAVDEVCVWIVQFNWKLSFSGNKWWTVHNLAKIDSHKTIPSEWFKRLPNNTSFYTEWGQSYRESLQTLSTYFLWIYKLTVIYRISDKTME